VALVTWALEESAMSKSTRPPDRPKQQQLQLTYSVGYLVFVPAGWTPRGRLLARVESATPIETIDGSVWLCRTYTQRRQIKGRGHWSSTLSHRKVERALSSAEIANLRSAGVVPHAGSEVQP